MPRLATRSSIRLQPDIAHADEPAMGMVEPAPAPEAVPAPATWLTDELGRARMLDMSPRVRALRNFTFILQEGVLLACAHWLGWWTVFPLLAVGVFFMVCERHMVRSPRPEIYYAAAW